MITSDLGLSWSIISQDQITDLGLQGIEVGGLQTDQAIEGQHFAGILVAEGQTSECRHVHKGAMPAHAHVDGHVIMRQTQGLQLLKGSAVVDDKLCVDL